MGIFFEGFRFFFFIGIIREVWGGELIFILGREKK